MLFSNIEIKGHSGCSIKVVEQGQGLLVIKSTDKKDYIARLKKQAEKQKHFFSTRYEKVQTPEIFDLAETKETCTITMKYIHSQNFVEFLDHAGFEKIDRFTRQIIQFLDWEVSQSKMQEIPDEVLLDKFTDVKNNIQLSFPKEESIKFIISRSENVFNQTKNIYIPVGQCHGDLTLSNLLFNNDRIFVIDFLDSFIESPLLDMIKIRQDTAFGWSYLMYSNSYDSVRHHITIEWMDKVLKEHFSKYDWYNQYYEAFQLMNFLRILQYAHQADVISYLIEKINEILESHEF